MIVERNKEGGELKKRRNPNRGKNQATVGADSGEEIDREPIDLGGVL